EKGMHDEKTVTMVRHLMDGVIEFEDDKISVLGVIGADREKHNFKMSSEGFEVFPSMTQLAKPPAPAQTAKPADARQPASAAKEPGQKKTLASFVAKHAAGNPAQKKPAAPKPAKKQAGKAAPKSKK
ncbi:MAG TPA: hypothetical protein PLO51_01120, partial [Candidatus Micrarchaeota archaeon]|nr:hypothetical protein [Candidatus Micrarchaeota archaeon]